MTDRPALADEDDWMERLAADPSEGEAAIAQLAALEDAELDLYLDSVQQAFRAFGAVMEERYRRGTIDVGRLYERYFVGAAWFTCELEVTLDSSKKRLALACAHPDRDVAVHVPLFIPAGEVHNCVLGGSNQQPMLIDVAKLVDGPEDVASPSLVCLYFLDEEGLDSGATGPKASYGFHLTGESALIVGKWETSSIGLSRDWTGKRYRDVIEGASKIPDGVTNESLDVLGGLMQRLKTDALDGRHLIRVAPDLVQVRRQEAGDGGLYLRNMVACAL